jgi:hypothetical protein
MQHKQLPEGVTIAALLQLAMNGSSHATAETAVHYNMPAQLEPAVVRQLLVTAATRQHDSAVQKMASLEVVKQHVDAPALHRTLQELLVRQRAPVRWHLIFGHVSNVSQLRNTSQLSIEAVCALPAAAQLGSDAVAQLLLVSLQEHAADQCFHSFSTLTAAAQINSTQLTEILQAAVQFRRLECTRMLSGLPAAEEMTSEHTHTPYCSTSQQPSA